MNNNNVNNMFTFIETLRRPSHSPSKAFIRLFTLVRKRIAWEENKDLLSFIEKAKSFTL